MRDHSWHCNLDNTPGPTYCTSLSALICHRGRRLHFQEAAYRIDSSGRQLSHNERESKAMARARPRARLLTIVTQSRLAALLRRMLHSAIVHLYSPRLQLRVTLYVCTGRLPGKNNQYTCLTAFDLSLITFIDKSQSV